MNNDNRFGVLRTSLEEESPRSSECKEGNLWEQETVELIKMAESSNLSAKALVFVPRFDNVVRNTDNVPLCATVRNPFANERRDFTVKNSPSNNDDDTTNDLSSDSWNVVKPKDIQKRHGNFRQQKQQQKFSVISTSSRQKATEAINKKRKTLIILRGPPGCGKSYLANADEYFVNDKNRYNFQPNRLEDAHSWCQQRAIRAMENRVTPVIIDNTNCQIWEMAPYVRSGIRNGYEIHFIIPDTPWAFDIHECAKRNKHKVGYDQVANFIQRFNRTINIHSFFMKRPVQKPVMKQRITTVPTSEEISPTEEHVEEISHHVTVRCANDNSPIEPIDNDSEKPIFSNNDDHCLDLHAWGDDDDGQFWDDPPKQRQQIDDYITPCVTVNDLDASDKTKSANTSSSSVDSQPKKQRTATRYRSPANHNSASSASLLNSSAISNVWELPNDLLGGLKSHENSQHHQQQRSSTTVVPDDWDESEYSYEIQVVDKACQVNETMLTMTRYLRQRSQSQSLSFDNDYHHSVDTTPLKYSKLMLSASNKKVFVDKSCQVENLHANNDDHERSPFEMLKSCFPNVLDDDLDHIFQNCDKDVQWATNVLLDSGHSINWAVINDVYKSEKGGGGGDNETISTDFFDDCILSSSECDDNSLVDFDFTASKPNSVEFCSEKIRLHHDDDTEMSELENQLSTVNEPLVEVSRDNDDDDYQTMELSVDMASQLQQLFGRLHDDLPAEYLSPRQMKVRLPFDLIAQIYQCWLNTQAETAATQFKLNDEDDEVFDFNEDYDKIDRPSTSSSSSSSSALKVQQQIHIDEMLARQILDEEQQHMVGETQQHNKQQTGNQFSLSNKLKLKELISCFPGVDENVLKELFRANEFRLEPTLDMVQQSFSQRPNRLGSSIFTNVSAVSDSPVSKQQLIDQVPRVIEEDELTYEQLRKDAFDHHQRRTEYFQKAQEAYRRGMKSVASFYAQIGRDYDVKMKEANRVAGEKVLEYRKYHNPQDTLDLHGLHVPEAIAALVEKLKDYENRPGKYLKVITGAGKHSDKGPKIKPAVIAFLAHRKKYK